MNQTLRVIIKEVGEQAKSVILTGHTLATFQTLVGGLIDIVPAQHRDSFPGDIAIVCNKQAQELGLKTNLYDIKGTFLLIKLNNDGEEQSLSDQDIEDCMALLNQGKRYGEILFSSEDIVATSLAANLLGERIHEILNRHFTGDWGNVCLEDKAANDLALKDGERIVSKYLINGESFYIITEHDRSLTTVMTSGEY